MLLGVFACLFFLFGVFPEAQTNVLQSERTVWTTAGESAHLSCQLLEKEFNETRIIQVTWQKISADGQKNIGSYNQIYGHTVNPGFKDKVLFKDGGARNSSIVIRSVSEQDEGCYLCVFTTFPEGSLSMETCLHVYELHEPVLHVRESPEESVVFCSATGRPAPTVTLTVTQQHLTFSQHNTSTVNNNNNTVTVTSTAVLSGYHDDSAQVGCTASVLSAQIQVFHRIQTSDASRTSYLTWIVVLCVSLVVSL